ncbi:MerR family transcriptional regulator [Furfurilactobacillus rossiae]|uniref:Transcriptional regulator n=1 Tax=Furfurilactobacillus rossiae DSM 15814 TaxID=1114972 RepID=A0A0R1RGY3_9LACO|nr:MerR family transcriptional regulator [Furfurilactobacillus rossiae]KRL52931.1 transcriptional regulator [Furfurilactobacillus rossiae DSM 15814]MCF6164676.1 MerR family transcriptional regulator [Furfurilactobacillus rossiae]QFR66762.1 MerR family transcriptional regulator [Furfurilactobacillus rossiae]QLE62244.1 regulatory protein MerR [Furfurilactobacillus rossiae]QLE64965.1 regulatory protein MerR [Furfurilactobacillus rossiae]
MYTVQEVAKKLGMTTYSIRYYDDHGLLPFVKRDENNNRLFDEDAIEWVNLVRCFRSTGMPIAEVHHYIDLMLAGDETIPERYQMMLTQQVRAQEQLADKQRQLAKINTKVSHYAKLMNNDAPDDYVPNQAQPDDNQVSVS